MKIITTAGKEYIATDQCAYCNIDTAGNHEINCPNYQYRIGFWKRV